MKSRLATAFLAFAVGGFGAHHFYLGNNSRGMLYLAFFWTFIPAIVAFIETIMFATMDDAAFDARYNKSKA